MNAQTRRTPGPWVIRDNYRKQDETVIYKAGPAWGIYSNGFNGDGNGTVWVEQAAEITSEENARFIVTACNAHDELVAALRETIPALIRLGDFVGNIDNGGPSKQGTIHRCAILLKVRELLAKVSPDNDVPQKAVQHETL